MSGPALSAVSVVPAGDRWAVEYLCPGRAEVRRTYTDRADAVLHAAQAAAMMGLPLVTVGDEPDDSGGTPLPLALR